MPTVAPYELRHSYPGRVRSTQEKNLLYYNIHHIRIIKCPHKTAKSTDCFYVEVKGSVFLFICHLQYNACEIFGASKQAGAVVHLEKSTRIASNTGRSLRCILHCSPKVFFTPPSTESLSVSHFLYIYILLFKERKKKAQQKSTNSMFAGRKQIWQWWHFMNYV